MNKVTGIKSVDFKIEAEGNGVVNWNGSFPVKGKDGKEVSNHTMPKLRGYSHYSGEVKEETGYQYKKDPSDINFKETPMYISQNCVRHHMFRENAYDAHFMNNKNLDEMLCSVMGLVRGYVLAESQCKRTSPLLIQDFVEKLGNGNFEQMGRAGSKEKKENKKGEESSNSIFSKTTFGDTKYESYGSISIEQLQFISLDNQFDRAAIKINREDAGEGKKIAEKIEALLKELAPDKKPKAVYGKNYVRRGSIYKIGEVGILLNNDAVDVLVNCTLDIIKNLAIRQAKGYAVVTNVVVDYNNTNRMMRIKSPAAQADICETPTEDYAVYFEEVVPK